MSKRWVMGMIVLTALGRGIAQAEPPSLFPVAATEAKASLLKEPALAPGSPKVSGSSVGQPVQVSIVVGGKVLDNDTPPLMVDGRVLIPLRKVFQALGASVVYERGVINAQRGQQTVELSPGVGLAKIAGKETALDVPPILVGAVTYVPLRFVAQALGDSVLYEAKTKTITVSASAPTAVQPAITVPLDEISVMAKMLKRFAVGNQGAILKLWNDDSTEVAYYRGLDDRDTAPYSDEDQKALLGGMGYTGELGALASDVMNAYPKLPKREAVAFLGLVHSIPDTSPLDPPNEVDDAIESFLIQVLKEDKDVVVRRQACLALAVSDSLDQPMLNAILDFYAGSENLWETFPVQQFFQYQAAKIRALPGFSQVRERVAAVNSLYTDASLRYLDTTKSQ